MPLAVRTPYTYREYLALPDDGKRYEIIDGDLFVSPAPRPWHQTVSRRIQYALMQQLEDPGIAWVFNAPTDLLLADTDVMQPDIVVVRCDRPEVIGDKALLGRPDLLVEILSPSSVDRDRHLKRMAYGRHSVPEYWIVEPEAGCVDQYLLGPGGLTLAARFDRSDVLTSPSFPEVRIVLAKVFAPLVG